jgi:GTP-binding protein Era
MHKAGFVSIIGKPNVGKSTLLNSLLGQHLSIVTHKAQTTRHRIKGIYNDENHQVVFSDTPGMIEPNYLMQEKMMGFVSASLEDADLVLFIREAGETQIHAESLEKLKALTVPLIVVINKADLSTQEIIQKQSEWLKENLKPLAVIPISALKKFNTEALLDLIKETIPESPPYFDKDELSDLNERFFVSEMVREQIFIHYKQEIPYSSEVSVDSFAEKNGITHISATIYVERDSQKAILIGKMGEGIKRVGTESRKQIQKFLGKKVHLVLFVKVEKDWRKDENVLRRFGYITNQ